MSTKRQLKQGNKGREDPASRNTSSDSVTPGAPLPFFPSTGTRFFQKQKNIVKELLSHNVLFFRMGILYFNRTDILINAARHTVKNGTQGKTDGRTQATLDAASDSIQPGAPRLFSPSPLETSLRIDPRFLPYVWILCNITVPVNSSIIMQEFLTDHSAMLPVTTYE